MTEPRLNDKLNLETARIHWKELQPHFARGAAVYVSPDLDLLAVANLVATDDSASIATLMQANKFGVVTAELAQAFTSSNQAMWAVVIVPWVLVQPCQA